MAQNDSRAPFSPLAPPPLARLHVWQIQAVRDVVLVLVIVGLVWLGHAIRAVTVPLLVALLLAYLFEPLVAWLTNRLRMTRPYAVAALLVAIGGVVVILLAIMVPLVVGQTARFVQDIRAGRFQHTILRLKEFVPANSQGDFERAIQWLMPGTDLHIDAPHSQVSPSTPPAESAPRTTIDPSKPALDSTDALISLNEEQRLRLLIREEIAAQDRPPTAVPATGTIWDIVRTSGRTLFGVIGGIVEFGLLTFLIPFYFFFFSVSFPAVVKYGRDMVPVANRPWVYELVGKMDRAVAGFVRGRIVICLIMGVMLAVGWMIVGVPYSIVLGLVIGAFSLVPYLGGVGVPLAIGLLAFQQVQLPETERMGWLAILAWPTVVFMIVQVVETYILTPMIAGKATNLDPVTILVAVLAGGSIGGVYGMLLAIPVAACLKIVWTDVLLPKIRAWTRGEAADPLPIGQR